MKKLKTLSDEFVISIGLLLASFFIFQAAILPRIVTEENLSAATIISSKNPYSLAPSKNIPGVFTFNYKFNQKLASSEKGEKLFDIPIEPFDKKSVPKSLQEEGALGTVVDTWGYPVRENAFMRGVKYSDRKKASINPFRSNVALAYDEDPDVVGLVNCRENTSINSYFKAYFEDVALDNHVGYDDDTYGPGRREEVCQVLQDIAELINLDDLSMVTPDFIFVVDPGDIPPNALAAASSYFDSVPGLLDNGFLHHYIISHDDLTPAMGHFDAYVITNFNGFNWDVDSDLNEGTYDFYSVMYHEILHTLGFRGLLPAVVSSNNDLHRHDIFDTFQYRDESLSNPFFNPTNFNLLVPTGAPSPWFITNDVVYRGIKNVIGATPDGIRPVFSPLNWQQGSSLSHFDMDRSNGEVYVMHPSIGTNTERSIHDHEKEVLCHLGYSVEGVSGCDHPTPWAEDDFVVLPENGDDVCIKPILNDGFFGSGPLTMNSSENTEIQTGDDMVFYSGTDCGGLIMSNAFDARSVLFSPGPSLDPRTITYDVKSVYDRVSSTAKINIFSLAGCSNDTDEYVCNGSFELNFLDGYDTSLECPDGWDPFGGDVIFWCNFFESETIVLSQSYSPALFGSQNGDYIADVNESFPAAFVTKLKQPLVAGEEYILSFDMADIDGAMSQSLLFGLNQNPSVGHPGIWFSTPETVPEQEIEITVPGELVSSTPGIYSWYRRHQPFVANGNYESLVFGSPIVKLFLDNVSIKRADAPIDEIGQNVIQGVVYHDIDSNGEMNTGDTGLPGVEVGLYDASDASLVQTVISEDTDLGEYEFTLVPDGDYYVALINETIFPAITDPGVMNAGVIPDHSHVYHVIASGGQVYGGRDFGLKLTGSNTFNLRVKKGLIDSTLSLVDRNITWSVEATNMGPDAAQNIDIVDHIPVPLIYYSHVTMPPNTFNPGTGIWHLPNLESGQTMQLLLTTKVPLGTCGVKINKANLESYDGIDTDPTDNGSQAQIKLRNCGGTVFPSVK